MLDFVSMAAKQEQLERGRKKSPFMNLVLEAPWARRPAGLFKPGRGRAVTLPLSELQLHVKSSAGFTVNSTLIVLFVAVTSLNDSSR